MAPQPPSQAGKFKPRKPAKKISVASTAAAATVAVPDGAPSSLVAGLGRGSRIGGGRSGGGRDGGRGRDGEGRGSRAPMPQGKAFFTAQPAPTAGSSRQRRSAAGSATTAQQQQQQQQHRSDRQGNASGVKREGATEEEIVGTLEEGVGSHVPAKVQSSGDSNKFSRDTAQSAFERALMGGEDNNFAGHNHGPDGYLYDSDSSREERQQSSRRPGKSSATPQPLTLPFPPVGGVEDSRGALYPLQNDSSLQRQGKPQQSPFVDLNNKKALKAERDAWFLVQWPTRLPPVKQQQATMKSDPDMVDTEDAVSVKTEETATVATAPMQLNAFDNALTKAVPGRIGKLKIYKSGKTVLVIEGPDGSPVVRPAISCARIFSSLFRCFSRLTSFPCCF